MRTYSHEGFPIKKKERNQQQICFSSIFLSSHWVNLINTRKVFYQIQLTQKTAATWRWTSNRTENVPAIIIIHLRPKKQIQAHSVYNVLQNTCDLLMYSIHHISFFYPTAAVIFFSSSHKENIKSFNQTHTYTRKKK